MSLSPYHKYIVPLSQSLSKNLNLRTALGFSISAVLLWFTFYSSGLKIKDLSIGRREFLFFLIAEVFFLLSVWIYAVRARLFWINDKRGLRGIQTFDSLIVGNFYNCILPGNLGEGMRALHFSKKNKIPFMQSISALLAEKWIDAQIFLILPIGLFIARPFIGHYIQYIIIYTSIAVIVLSFVYTLMRRFRSVERKLGSFVLLFKKPGRIFYRLYWFTSRLITDLLQSDAFIKYLFFCIVIFAFNVFQFLFLLYAADVSQPVGGAYSAYLIAISMMFIAIIPSAPSNIGVMHYGIYSVLMLSATQHGVALDPGRLQSYARLAVYVHLSFVLPEVMMGIIFVIKERKLVF